MNKTSILYDLAEKVTNYYSVEYTKEDFDFTVSRYHVKGIDFNTLCALMSKDIPDFEITWESSGGVETISAYEFFENEIRELSYEHFQDSDFEEYRADVEIIEDDDD